MDTIVVAIYREIQRRPAGDVVVHWLARIAEPAMRETGRSLERVERALREYLGTRPGWTPERANAAAFQFELVEPSNETREALASRAVAVTAAAAAAAAERAATVAAIRALLVGTPAVSVRDAALILGVSRTLVQKVAREHATAQAGKKSRAVEVETTLEGRIPPSAYAARRAALRRRGPFNPKSPWRNEATSQ